MMGTIRRNFTTRRTRSHRVPGGRGGNGRGGFLRSQTKNCPQDYKPLPKWLWPLRPATVKAQIRDRNERALMSWPSHQTPSAPYSGGGSWAKVGHLDHQRGRNDE